MANITEALKTDIAHLGDFKRSPSGDLQIISGLDNLKQALFHRLITVPGSLVHKPLYGVGVQRFQNGLSSFGKQQQLAALIQEQFEQDPRVQAVSSVSINTSDDQPELVMIAISVKPVGYTEVTMKFTPFGDGL